MSHVDEGALHAYLDGALDHLPASEAARIRDHLAACDACSLRLEEERALRLEAASILAGADPGAGDLPPLEELRALARAGGRSSAGLRLRRLTWAASIVVAGGTGWLLRGAQQAPPPSTPVGVEASMPERVEPVAEGRAEAGRAAVDRTETEQAAVSHVSTGQAAALRTQEDAPEPVAAGRGGALTVMQDSLEARLGETRVRVAEEKSAAVPAPSAAPAPTTFGDRPVAAPAVFPSRTDMEPGFDVTRRMVAQSPERERLTDARSDVTPMVVPGLPVVSVTSGVEGLPIGAVRVLQRLDGDTLELIHVSGGEGPPLLPREEGDDRVEVVRRSGTGWVVGRARVSRDHLAALLDRMVGAGG